MVPLLLESWEPYGGDATQAGRNWSSTPGIDATHVKTGSYAFYGGSGGNHNRVLSITSASVTFGMHVYWTSPISPFIGVLLGFVSGTGFDGFNAVCALNLEGSGALRVSRTFNPGTTLDTSAACLNSGQFNFIEATFAFGASGAYVVKCNGVEVLNGSGDMGGTTINSLIMGGQGQTTYAVDNLWMFEGTTLLGEQIVSAFFPTANGANTGLTPSTGVNHAALVDEAIANDDTDYNSGGAGVKDTYVFDPSSLSGFTINAAQLSLCAKATVAGTNTIAGVARIGGSDYDGATQAITTAYDYYQQLWAVRPSDSAAWTAADLTDLGMKSVASAGANRLTQIALEVLSTPSVSFVLPPFIHHYRQQGIM